MWQAKLLTKRKEKGNLFLTVRYHNDETKEVYDEVYQRVEDPGENWLGEIVAKKIARLESVSGYEQTLEEDQKITPIEPTKSEKDKEEKRILYQNKFSELEIQKRLVDAGVLTEEEAGISDLQEEVKTLLSSYQKA